MTDILGPIGSPGAKQTFAVGLTKRLRAGENILDPVAVSSTFDTVTISESRVNYSLIYDGVGVNEVLIQPGKGVLFQVTTSQEATTTVELMIEYLTDRGNQDRVKVCLEVLPWIACS